MQGKSIAIFYGSQTGTAEEFAGRLAKDAQRYGLKALVLDPEECDMVSEVVYNNLRSQDLGMFEIHALHVCVNHSECTECENY